MKKRKLTLFIMCSMAIVGSFNIELKAQEYMAEGRKICYKCHGEGRETCPVCTGSGLQPYSILGNKSFPMLDELTILCTRCSGSGKITCTVCGGTGTLQEESSVK